MNTHLTYIFYAFLILFSCGQNKKENSINNDVLLGFQAFRNSKFKTQYGIEFDTIKFRLTEALNSDLTPAVYFAKPLNQRALNKRPNDDIFAMNVELFEDVVQYLIDSGELCADNLGDQLNFRQNVAILNRSLYWTQFPLMVAENPLHIFNFKNDFIYGGSFYLQFASFMVEDYFEAHGFFEYYSNKTDLNRIEEIIILNDYMLRGITYAIAQRDPSVYTTNWDEYW